MSDPTDDEVGHPELVLALDVDDLVAATRLADELKPWFSTVKVGLELYTAAGQDAVAAMVNRGLRVFLDLKLYDIPTTVGRAARVAGSLGASYLTIPAAAGAAALRAGVEGLGEAASDSSLPPPGVLAVTVLTSEPEASPGLVRERTAMADEAGCLGVVCAASDLIEVKRLAPHLLAAVPGLRLDGEDVHDHGRPSTPAAAAAAGADLLIVGRAVTASPNRSEAAARLVASLSS